jgi:hypothetical protein
MSRSKRSFVAVVLLVAVAPACSRTSGPVGYVDRLVVVNPTVYDVNVAVGPAGASGSSSWVVLGMVPHEDETAFEEVVDQGETWVLRLDYGGEDGGAVSVRRADLARNGWRVSVPPEVAQRLEERGVTPPP